MLKTKSAFSWGICLTLILGATLPTNVLLFSAKTQAQTLLTPQSQDLIYVNSNTGDDQNGKGTQTSPFKTLTQALMIAKPQSTILLAPGTYSETTGENFPLIINNNITVKGTPAGQGIDVVIRGGGVFISPTAAGQNVAIVIEKAGNLTGVTVTNPDLRGYGLWIESANALVDSNSFKGNGNAGVSLNGNSVAKFINNYFYNNGGNGLIATGKSQGELEKNIFEKTGFGVSLIQESSATLTNNRFRNNRIAVILEGKSQGNLRNNLIETNTEHGLVAVGQSQVDLGTKSLPGGNTFRGNRGVDVKNINGDQAIVAYGNQLGKYEGKINFDSNRGEIKQLPPLNTNQATKPQPAAPVLEPLPPPPPLKVIKSPEVPQSNTNSGSLVYRGRVLEPLTPQQPTIIADKPTEKPPLQAQTTPTASSAVEIPVIPASDPPKLKPSNYRIVVPVTNNTQAKRVRGLYPDAFSVVYNGKPMLQVGIFSTKQKADNTLRNLKKIGLTGIVAD